MSWQELLVIVILSSGIASTITAGLMHYYSSKMLAKYKLVHESQFKAFNELWKSLAELKLKFEELWGELNWDNLLRFSDSLESTKESLEVNSVLLNEGDYNDLKDILNIFANLQVGKTRLMALSKNITSSSLEIEAWEDQINSNKKFKVKYEELLNNLKAKFKIKMGVV